MQDKQIWTTKQKRCYHRLRSMLCYWEGNGYQILRVDLTSSRESNVEDLRKNFRLLRRKVETTFDFPEIEDFIVETAEGNGVLHMIWAWKAKKGFREKPFYIPKQWLSDEWSKLHKAIIVHIAEYDQKSSRSRNRVSAYIVSHYLSAGQGDLVRYSYSWRRSLGFPMVSFWKQFKVYWLDYACVDYKEMLVMWEYFLQGKRLPDLVDKGRFFYTIDEMRGQKIC